MRRFVMCGLAAMVLSGAGLGAPTKPVPVKTCADVKAWLDDDGSMTMETLKQVMIAAGYRWNPAADQGFEGNCKAAALKINVHTYQQIFPTKVIVGGKVVDEAGVCRLREITFEQCE